MNHRRRFFLILFFCWRAGFDFSLFAQPTAFTYQGRLNDTGNAANGRYDLRGVLFNASAGGTQAGPALTNNSTAVSNGLFTVSLDFGPAVFNGTSYWLELAVRTNGVGVFTPLLPRQPLGSVPYSSYAANAGQAASATTLSGALPTASLAGNYAAAVSLNNPSNQFNGAFAGSGAGLTNLPWLEITVGQSNAMFGPFTAGTTSSGLQEALNFLPYNQITNGLATGGKIIIGPGNYYVADTLKLTNRFLTSVILEGAGEIASVIHYTGNNMGATATGLTGQPDGARLHLYVRDLAFIMDQNVTNAFWDLQEWATVSFKSCFFSYNGYTTNSQWGISPASSLPDPVTYPKKCGGIYLHGANENNTWVDNCHFNGLAFGINASAAHVFIRQCEFVDIGDYTGGTTNGWPITSPNATGSGVIFNAVGYEAKMDDCDFVSGRTTFSLLNTPAGHINVAGCYYESMGACYNDDSGAILKMSRMASDAYTVRQISSANYTLTSGALSMMTMVDSFANDNIEYGSSPFWSIYANGQQQFQMMNDFSFRFAGNVVLAPGASFKGNGSTITNLNAASLTGTLRPGNLPGVTTNLVIPGATLYVTNGLIMRVSQP